MSTAAAQVPHTINGGVEAHILTEEERRRGAAARWERERERQAELEQQAAQLIADEFMGSLRTYVDVRDDPDAKPSEKLAAADRIVERVIGKVGDRLTVRTDERREIVVRVEMEKAAELVRGLRDLGVLDR